MFAPIRRKLTLLYTGLMMTFLLVFMGVSFFVLASQTYTESKNEIAAMLQTLAGREHHEEETEEPGDRREGRRRLESRFNPGPDLFYYMVDEKGRLLGGSEWDSDIREPVLSRVADWRPQPMEFRLESVHEADDDGEERLVLLAGAPLNDHGYIVGTVYGGKDVTAAYHVLARLLTIVGVASLFFLAAGTLAGHYMAGRAMEPIAQSFQRQRQFVADASHELRTPLSVLQSSLEVLEGEEENRLNDFSRQVLADMKDEVGRMGRLVADLLTLARADSGVLDLSLETFDLHPAAERLVRSLQHVAGNKGVAVDFTGPETFLVHGDRERLLQLMSILLDNGIKYTPEGGRVTLSLSYTGQGKGRQAVLAVADTGVGIPKEEQEKIFTRFYRVDKDRSREQGGTGLGLSIAQWITDAHGGSIRVESEPGRGSVFTVRLPMPEKG